MAVTARSPNDTAELALEIGQILQKVLLFHLHHPPIRPLRNLTNWVRLLALGSAAKNLQNGTTSTITGRHMSLVPVQ